MGRAGLSGETFLSVSFPLRQYSHSPSSPVPVLISASLSPLSPVPSPSPRLSPSLFSLEAPLLFSLSPECFIFLFDPNPKLSIRYLSCYTHTWKTQYNENIKNENIYLWKDFIY